jgi:hypothetical protein
VIAARDRQSPALFRAGLRFFLLFAAAASLLAPRVRANQSDGDWLAQDRWDWFTQYKEGNLHYDQLALHPYYTESEIYDSNIYLVPHDQPGGQVGGGVVSSWIIRNDLGLETDLPWNHINDLKVGYDFDDDHYTTAPSINDTINQAVHADFVRNGANGMTYKAGDQYLNTTDQAFSELVQRARRWMNRAYAEADYTPQDGRLAWGVNADDERDKYLDPTLSQGLDRYEQDFGANVGYMIQPKTKAYVSYQYSIIHYSVPQSFDINLSSGAGDKNNRSHTAAAGVIGQLTQKITGQIEVGDTYRYYDAAPAGDPTVYRSPVVTTKLTWAADKYTDVVLTLSRIYEESIDSNNAFYYSNVAMLDLKHKFPYKFTAGIEVAAGLDQYVNQQTVGTTTGYRHDDNYQGGIWVEYDIQKWLSTGLSYVYRERDSTFSGEYNFQDTQVAWNLSIKL